jgi:hypothetical protein
MVSSFTVKVLQDIYINSPSLHINSNIISVLLNPLQQKMEADEESQVTGQRSGVRVP